MCTSHDETVADSHEAATHHHGHGHGHHGHMSTAALHALVGRMSQYLTHRELPAMVLSLVPSHHVHLKDRALRLGILMLRAEEGAGHTDADRKCDHAFRLAFQGSMGRRALESFRHVFDEHKQRLIKRQHELMDELAELDESEENLDVDVVRSILQLVEHLCMGCYAPMQALFRHQENELEQVLSFFIFQFISF